MTEYQDLTPAEKKALQMARVKGGLHVGTGRQESGEPAPERRVGKAVADRLIARGLAVKPGRRLLTVEAGHAELAKPEPHKPWFLRERDGLTQQRALAVRDEGEVMESTPAQQRAAEARRLEDQDRRTQARENARKAKRAA